MRTKQLFLTLALLCAIVQGAWAQASWDEVYAMTNTTSANWTALPEGTTAGATIGTAGATTYYYASKHIYYGNHTPGGSALTILGTVYIYMPYSFSVTCTGANADGQTGAGAGIELTEGNSLFLLGQGEVNATGGKAANGGDGTNGSNANWDNSNYWSGTGGTGGHGGGGAGAGIGTRGGQGGNGGAGAASVTSAWSTAGGSSGAAGQAGATAGAMGELYVAQSFGNLTATGGAAASQSGSAGSAGKGYLYDGTYNYSAAGGGGGGGGGFGGAATGIGTGGPGGGGGGGGASSNLDWASSGYYVVKAPGGSGGQNANGTWAAAGGESIMNHDGLKNGQVVTNGSGWEYDQYNYDSYVSSQAVGTGGSGGALGNVSTSEQAVTFNLKMPAQGEWDMVCQQTNTSKSQWTALPLMARKGATIGAAGTTTYYFATGDGSFTNSNAGGSGLTILGTVHIFIPSGNQITCTGANATAPTGGGAGIELAAGNTLYLIGSGRLVATGGNAANGGNGGAGGDADFSVDNWIQRGAGGKGGDGGGGAGAGIGTCGGAGGAGGTGGAGNKLNLFDGFLLTGNVGGNGASGSTAAEMGTLYIYQLPAPTTEFHGGSGGTASDNGGNGGRHALYLYQRDIGTPSAMTSSWSIGGGGGGGGGGFGGAASDIGTGGPGGGGGGGGASGSIKVSLMTVFYHVGALGGSPGTNVDGTLAGAGESTVMESDNKNLLARKYPEDRAFENWGWLDGGDNRAAGGNGSNGVGAASVSGTYNVAPAIISLADNADNSTTINTADGFLANVTLQGRTLYKDGKWNTLCLPFNVTLSGSPLNGATARSLTEASISGSTLTLTFGDAVTTLKAGTPYIIKWTKADDYVDDNEHNIANPVFSGVTIDKTDRSYDNGISGDNRVRFVGTYKSTAFDSEDKSILLLGGKNKLYYPTTGAGIGSCRAYFKIGEDGAAAPRLTGFNIDFGDDEATGIISTTNDTNDTNSDAWFTLDGRKLDGKPTAKGLYIVNGKKVIVK